MKRALVFITTALLLIAGTTISSCNGKPTAVPTAFADVTDSADIFPDYRDVTVPPNIAPLNFMVTDTLADAFVADVGGIVCGASADGKIDIDSTAWRKLLSDQRGKSFKISVYTHRSQGWVRHPAFNINVARENVDPYVTYRLIEPGYEIYQQLGIYQRDLTNFDVKTVYENHRDINPSEGHCINCHKFQDHNAQRMYLHVRENHKGTVFVDGTDAHKIMIKHDSILASGAYGNWHPRLPFVAYSTNRTAQVFHYNSPSKIEVYDGSSDLLLYDVEHNEVRHIIRTTDHFETFPCWSADGTRLYYCDAHLPKFSFTDSNFEANLVLRYDSLFYDIYSMPFDTVSHTFGQPRLEVDASSLQLSASEPVASPDGRFLLYSLARYGQFHLYHKDADLWIKNLESGEVYPLAVTNSTEGEGYSSWSSNSHWIVFSSRRDDGDYTRSYIAYIDDEGRGHKPFMLPQRDPEYNLLLLKSFNVPEFSYNAVSISQAEMEHAIRFTEADMAAYKGHVAKSAEAQP